MSEEQTLDITQHTTAIDNAFDAAVNQIEGIMQDDPKQAMQHANKLDELANLWRMNIDQLYSDIDDAGADNGAWNDA